MQTLALFAALRPPHEEAAQLRQQGDFVTAERLDRALWAVAGALLPEVDDDHAAARAARALLVLERPLPLDVLASRGWSPIATRLAALTLIPAVPEMESLEDIRGVIFAAINQGAPLYNAGDIRGCATRYFVTALALALAPATRGFPGQTRALRPLRDVAEVPARLGAAVEDDFAWHLRRALDAALAVTG